MEEKFIELDVSKIRQVPSDTEIPVHDNYGHTERALCTEFPQNKEILTKLEAVFNPEHVTECTSDLFKGDYETIVKIDDLKKALSELLIRFDTNPQNYTKKDYSYLMSVLYKTLLYIYKNHPLSVITKEWLDPHSDLKVPSEKLVKETIDVLLLEINYLLETLRSNLNLEITNRTESDNSIINYLESEVLRLEGLVYQEETARELADLNLQNTKQDNLTAGENISIENNVISAVDTIYDDTEVRGLISQVDLKVDALDEFECGEIVPTTTNFVEGTEYTVHEALQRTANLFGGFQGEIDDINGLIPNQATEQNQLADKDFVNSTVATNAANFRGNWSNWTNVPTNANQYPEDYVGNRTPTNNDYMVVQDASDYSASYQGSWRFIYVGSWTTNGKSGWNPQYRIGSSFTAEQQAAIDSTITATKVNTYDGYGTDITALQTDKLDKNYTANKIYGTDSLGAQTVYTLGNGLGFNNGQIECTINPTISEETVGNDVPTKTLEPNKVYIFQSRTNNLTLTLGTPTSGIVNEYHIFIYTGSTAPAITFPNGISWVGFAPNIEANKKYEVSILNNIAIKINV